MKKTSEDLVILQMCTINDSHMMYGSLEFFVILDQILFVRYGAWQV